MISGPAVVRSTGTGSYRELQVSVRQTWPHDQQLFVSYVRSSAHGELNDFAALFQTLDTPLLQPGGPSRLPADAPHRWIAWGTFNLPRRIVVSPVIEWHSGFPYSVVDERYRYVGTPNQGAFPAFVAADFVVFKTFTVRRSRFAAAQPTWGFSSSTRQIISIPETSIRSRERRDSARSRTASVRS